MQDLADRVHDWHYGDADWIARSKLTRLMMTPDRVSSLDGNDLWIDVVN